ncbi:hypothetical protein Y032_0108g4 [Ancylostoma ceylanicum]|uniref:Uncharacterized protein n=1 Tax=Ancylostoma ceylanicum TaxID=53326 RepID=A0A016TF79_9BILA|nr:hypothetical protein Y032_0108g4 [Ancylostoma ceylanicum]
MNMESKKRKLCGRNASICNFSSTGAYRPTEVGIFILLVTHPTSGYQSLVLEQRMKVKGECGYRILSSLLDGI